VRSPKSLKGADEQAAFAALEADVAVVAAYGLILPQAVLDAPPFGCLNVHASLLPRWRGAAPVQRAIMAGDEVTGVTIMQMEAGLDTGPMLLVRDVRIDRKNAAQLTEELAEVGAETMVEVLGKLGELPLVAQPEDGVTYAAKIAKEEARIDWARTAGELVRQVQGLGPFPGAWFEVAGERIKLLAAEAADGSGAPGTVIDERLLIACGTGAIRPNLLQRAGRSPMTADELLRGFAIAEGSRLA
jgi:methionyl-tRNA formyltransferase